jgi:hypothetical protein
MNMLDVTAMNFIVVLVLLFAAGLVVAWAASPRLRAWIEKPGYRFQENARRYDQGLSERNRL